MGNNGPSSNAGVRYGIAAYDIDASFVDIEARSDTIVAKSVMRLSRVEAVPNGLKEHFRPLL